MRTIELQGGAFATSSRDIAMRKVQMSAGARLSAYTNLKGWSRLGSMEVVVASRVHQQRLGSASGNNKRVISIKLVVPTFKKKKYLVMVERGSDYAWLPVKNTHGGDAVSLRVSLPFRLFSRLDQEDAGLKVHFVCFDNIVEDGSHQSIGKDLRGAVDFNGSARGSFRAARAPVAKKAAPKKATAKKVAKKAVAKKPATKKVASASVRKASKTAAKKPAAKKVASKPTAPEKHNDKFQKGKTVGRSATNSAGLSAIDAPVKKRSKQTAKQTAKPRNPALHRFPAESAAKDFNCHAEMRSEVQVGQIATIQVMVSLEQIELKSCGVADRKAGKFDPSTDLMVQIFPRLNFEVVGDADRALVVPPQPSNPIELMFDVRATHTGSGEVWVVIRQGAFPLARLSLKPHIVKQKTHAPLRFVDSKAQSPQAVEPAGTWTQLHVVEQRNGNELRYRFQLIDFHLEFSASGLSDPISIDRNSYVRALYKEIEGKWAGNKKDADALCDDLREYGAALWAELFPMSIKKVLWENRSRIGDILLITEEPFFPWEIVCLCEPGSTIDNRSKFLSELGMVRWLDEAGWPSSKIPHPRNGRGALHVIPDYPHPDYKLPEAQGEALFLKRKFGSLPLDETSAAVRDVLAEGTYSLLHFACHGAAKDGSQIEAILLMKGRMRDDVYVEDRFSAHTVSARSRNRSELGPGPMIVLNACQAGRGNSQLTSTGGFAQAFLKGGASVFVGPLWSVEDGAARKFTEALYDGLDEGLTIGKAVLSAREATKHSWDCTWLAYAVYAHPFAKFWRD